MSKLEASPPSPVKSPGEGEVAPASVKQKAAEAELDEPSGARSVTAPQQTLPPIPDAPLDPDPDPAPAGEPSLEELEAEARRQLEILRDHARDPSPPPDAGRPVDEFVWGLAQPALGLRVLVRHGDLFVRGLVPAVLFVLLCLLVVDRSEVDGLWGAIAAYYGVLVGAASISPVLFTRNYAKLAAESRRHLDVPRHEPYLRSYGQAFSEAILQAILLGVGVAPLAAVIGWLPLFGGIWAALIGWLWLAHWIVVEALDSARTVPPGEEPETLEQRHAKLDPPWYSGAVLGRLRAPLNTLLSPIRTWGSIMARLGRRWRGEVALVETRPWVAAGFAAGASLLLAIPVLNLLFRPAIVVAASHLLGRLEPEVPLPELDDDELSEGSARPGPDRDTSSR